MSLIKNSRTSVRLTPLKKNRILKRTPFRSTSKHAEQALYRAAKSIFAARGYDGATVEQIADAAGTNNAMISYYFGGKEGLYKKCLEGFGNQGFLVAQRILSPANSEDEMIVRLKLFADEMIQSYLDDPELATLVQRECDEGAPHANPEISKSLLSSFNLLNSFFEAAKKKHLIHSEIDPRMAATLFYGLLNHWTRRHETLRKFLGVTLDQADYRSRFLDHMIHIFIQGVRRCKESK
ncbi:MAG: hypothetical protein JWQ35_627 [Bacteriovoracaceae bacterium]|nr:hypothetical protein [Bacteriovoracaceae bacterium]